MGFSIEVYYAWMDAADLAANLKFDLATMAKLLMRIARACAIVVHTISIYHHVERGDWSVAIMHHDLGQTQHNNVISTFRFSNDTQ